ncbi:4Fe-4S binding protein [Methanoculleus frigidifontis]|uniref:4Fe-4S binding protein n=1 Tax=Methanoculleus frigidifontis TaxID=2584085 RepID=UPI00265A87B7|nr:4Fe-4S binding protein [Methanoculleus sp. FWC-SCC1]
MSTAEGTGDAGTIAVVSAKGGAGRTTLAAALARAAPSPMVMADCSLEVPDLALIFPTEVLARRPLESIPCAVIDPTVCVECLSCMENCRFGAIAYREGRFVVDPAACTGCGLCLRVCPVSATGMAPRTVGDLCLSRTPHGLLSHARLRPGFCTSGTLVAAVRGQARAAAEAARILLIDAPAGTGEAFAAAVAGAEILLVVAEPDRTAVRDLARMHAACAGHPGRVLVVINRSTLNPETAEEVRTFCRKEGLPLAGEIPFDEEIYRGRIPAEAARKVWERLGGY